MKKVEKSKIWWDEKEKIVRGLAIGPFDEMIANWVLKETQRMADIHGSEIDWLVDLTRMTHATSAARKLLAEASRHPSIRNYAFFGASIFIRTIGHFILAAAGQKNARIFDTEEQALKWLRRGEKIETP